MGGAERNARKRKQDAAAAAKAMASARKSDRTKMWVGVGVVVVIAAAIFGGIYFTAQTDSSVTSGAIPKVQVNPTYPVTRDNAIVVAGKDTAKTTVDLYADFLCPGCGGFEKQYGTQIQDKLNSGELKVRYHMLPMLVKLSKPEGYSLDSANAALAVAKAAPEKFPDFFASLYGKQPKENGAGYTKDQLIQLARDLGVPGEDFANDIRNGTNNQALQDSFANVDNDPGFKDAGGFTGTPAVVADGKKVDLQNTPTWFEDLFKK
ncbi:MULTISPECIES: thioredoxin domain-containing protein [unclassified Crossiella]|uniref:DsbA family protein n=1 Tax=unclassified Crossiella TaxID=2620835 RepID=UPI001FFF393D|nr:MULTISPECIES: thioredoxin domain-containing protein [unclassified Crossiella]MCK2237395.1 DsbA family protein [Crossiella sp. S99.2]MCK2251050.1 DsbA family protein [Crossiella sp. S99.1]